VKLAERSATGVSAAPGIARAVAWLPRRAAARDVTTLDADADTVREAFAAVATEFAELAHRMHDAGHSDEASILEAEAAIAIDEELVDGTLAAMADGAVAGVAIQSTGELLAAMLEELESPYLRERAADIRQVVRRVVGVLAGESAVRPPSQPFVLLDTDVGPVDLLEAAGAGLAGAVSLHGGVNAHAAIIARSLGIPFLIGIDVATLHIRDHCSVLVDADNATLVVDPSPAVMSDAEQRISQAASRRSRYVAERALGDRSADGQVVSVMCNVASAAEATIGMAACATGVGLLRTELPFLDVLHWPTEQMHRDVLAPIFEVWPGAPVTVRLMDFSNDKLPPFLLEGPTGLEALLAHPDAVSAQLRAIVDVGRRARTRIMLPMVRTAAELRTIRTRVRRVCSALDTPEPALGAMIELPEAAADAASIAETADFFSLGTNDLTAATLGLTRLDQGARPALAAHPQVLRHIVQTCAAAADAGIPVSVCGDAGGDPLVLPLLLGAGVRTFSVSPARVDEVRYRIRRIDAAAWALRLPEILALSDVESVWDFVERTSTS